MDGRKGTSLWLVPNDEDAERLKTIMRARQSEHHNYPSSYPTFHPHVTLASFPSPSTPPTPETIRAAIEPVLQQSGSLAVKFQSVDIGDHFFRSVYIAVVPTPALLALHKDVHASLGIEPRTPSFPHVSLCYIDDADARGGERERFLEELKKKGMTKTEGETGVSLRCPDAEGGGWFSEFGAKEVWVAECDGPVESWNILDKIPIA
ncbi:hypothetical protein DXG01_000375 [Tephrocybe rancida]|nr:hypothetical protein DXG01_000375 [Tephrocybe rancida]